MGLPTARAILLLAALCPTARIAHTQQSETLDLRNTKWALVRFETSGGTVVRPDDPKKYVIQFGGQVDAQLGCNKLQSTWNASGPDLTLGALQGASEECAPESLTDRMVRDWTQIESYSVISNVLHLRLKGGRGSYLFERLMPIVTNSPTGDYPLQFDSKGVEFEPWIRKFRAELKGNWYVPYSAMSLHGHTVLAFEVHKDGRLTNVELVTSSGVASFDDGSRNALLMTDPTVPLPAEYPAEKVHFTVTFFYNEKPPDTPATVSRQ